MNGIFPTTGCLIMQKDQIQRLQEYYEVNKIKNDGYSGILTKNNSLLYFNNDCNLFLENVTHIDLISMKKILNIFPKAKAEEKDPIDDGTILSNPFFTTLKQIN